MIPRIVRRGIRFLGSSVLATLLLAIVVAYSALASFVPQGPLADPSVAIWAAEHPLLGAITRVLGMHHAFTSFLFLGCASLLAVSAVLCSWARTRVAIHRSRQLRQATELNAASLPDSADLRIMCDSSLSESEVLERTADELEILGVRVRRRDNLLVSLSPVWTVWGSPVFHWALVGFMAAIVIAALVRSDGLMGLAVGEEKAHAPSSYGFLDAGPLHSWNPVDRVLRLDRFESEYVVGGLDRGPTPTITLLDERGEPIESQRIYPNNPLKSGSLTVHADEYGLAVHITLLDAAGAETAKGIQYVDFATDDPAGTRPLGAILLRDEAGEVEAQVDVTVPLDTLDGGIDYWMPADPTARLRVKAPDGRVIDDHTVAPGQELRLASGTGVRVDSIDWYYRLAVVDEPMTPVIYVLLLVAFLGLTVSLVARQQLLVAASVETSTGLVLVVKLRFWRNVPCEREEITDRLILRLGPNEGETNHDA